jgi:hypothetical protein
LIFSCAWSSIQLLFPWRRPFAIRWRIIFVTVDSVNRFASRSFAHVSQEVFEQPPPLANFDPTTAIQIKINRERIMASVNHASPGLIGWRPPVEFRIVPVKKLVMRPTS